MIDISLVEQPVNTSSFTMFNDERPCLFLGFAVKNEYDNQRLHISEKYKPRKQLFAFKREVEDKISYDMLPLYGLFLDLNEPGKNIARTLVAQDKQQMHLNLYEDILNEYNFTCTDSYSYLNKGIYPFDFEHFTKLTNDKIVKDKKILQHMLDIDDNEFDFQKFGAFKLLILG